MLTDLTILIVTVLAGAVLFYPKLRRATGWRATVTPLASIIGSGFLVLGPVLDDSFGAFAPVVMLGLCAVAYAFGGAIRANIHDIDANPDRGRGIARLETVASWLLAGAYFISVAYYLNLFGAFAATLTPWGGAMPARIITTVTYAVILMVGWVYGFHAMERMEQASVTLKLAIIAGLLAGLAVHFTDQAIAGGLVINPVTVSGWGAVTLAFGLIVTVQGFETSRYLGDTYSADMRVRSMRWAQLISAAIYMIYICLLVYLFPAGHVPLSETAVIDMMAIVAPVLPPLLIVAALSAQFSAAVADTGGSGGLVTELTKGRLGTGQSYAVLVAVGLALTWGADVFAIIAYASRAFAAYYAVQAAIAAQRGRPIYWALAVLGAGIAIFGRSVEG